MSNTVQSTTDYRQFNKITLNRDTVDGHVRSLMKAIEEQGNISEISPVIVNENMDVIDGQHRVLALKELGLPVFYLVMSGTNINTVRQMNTLQRGWKPKDFANSYAASGNKNYQRFLKLQEDYGYPYSILLEFVSLNTKGMNKNFRNGDLSFTEERDTEVRTHLDLLSQVNEIEPRFKGNRSFAFAFKQISKNPDYDHAKFLRKLKLYGQGILRQWANHEEYLRAFEVIYNFKQSAENSTRLY